MTVLMSFQNVMLDSIEELKVEKLWKEIYPGTIFFSLRTK
jgi:hypothetical protein